MDIETNLVILTTALAIEAAVGYPAPVFRAIGHPVMWIGALIAWLDRNLNQDTFPERVRRRNGVLALIALIAATVAPASILHSSILLFLSPFAAVPMIAVAAAALLAQRSLFTHVEAVADGLDREGLQGGRTAVAMIVGRNPETLDEHGVARAAIESLAENFSDGVVAPALWCGLLGLPGIVLYKAVNTADSMIGHRTPRHGAFGWASARLDDLLNLPASRLAALLLVTAAVLHRIGHPRGAASAVLKDARHHRSPNAGWPEAAMAGALGLRLNGPKTYGDVRTADRWMGCGRVQATSEDIRNALSLYRLALGVELAAVATVALLIAQV